MSNHPFEHWPDFRTAKRSQTVEEQPNVTSCGGTAKRSQAAKEEPKTSLTLQTGAREVDGATACHQMERHLVLVGEIRVHLKLLNRNRKRVSFVYF